MPGPSALGTASRPAPARTMHRWSETESPHFSARHAERDEAGALAVLELLEGQRERLGTLLPRVPDRLDVVLHSSPGQLALAQPAVPVMRGLTAPAARRSIVGWFSQRELHVLAPRVLAARASAGPPGTLELLTLAPVALYSQLACGLINPAFAPPFRPGTVASGLRWAWLVAGSGAWLSGQMAHARPVIARRLRAGGEPRFPPALRDAQLLGGTVFDLLAREEGHAAAVRLAIEPPQTQRSTLERAFRGRSLVHTSGAWRAHLSRLAGS